MQYSKYYHVYPRAIPADVCQSIIQAGLALEQKPASVREGISDASARQSTIAFFTADNPHHYWVFKLCEEWIRHANTNFFRFHLNRLESVQFTRYQPGQYYGWHPDAFRDTHIEERYKGMNRKLSMTLQLSPEGHYAGGDFQIELPWVSPEKIDERIATLTEAREQGTMIVFHSHLWHQVQPITTGERFSLVAWYIGNDWV